MELLKNQRKTVKGRFTRLQTYLDNIREPSIHALQVRLTTLEEIWTDFKKLHDSILELNVPEEIRLQEEEYATLETKYFDMKAILTALTQGNAPQSSVVDQQLSTPRPNTDVKLPRVQLTTFNGNYLEWTPFRDLYMSMVHDNVNLTKIQKFHYLKTSLTGEAAGLIQSLELTEANYDQAWKLLQERYQNKRQLVACHFNALFAQSPIAVESPTALRKLLDTTVKHVRALEALKLSTSDWDPILVHMTTERLDPSSRREWELTVSNKHGDELPSFENLKIFLEQRCRALEASSVTGRIGAGVKPTQLPNRKGSHKPATSVLHTRSGTVNTNSNCVVCGGDHPVYRCAQFQEMNLEQRQELAKVHHLCFNCLRRQSHTRATCPSVSRCVVCKGKHHSLLHNEGMSATPQNVVRPNSSAVVVSNCTRSSASELTFLSTALVRVKDFSGQSQLCRVLLDNGAEASLISETCARKLRLKRSFSNDWVQGLGQGGEKARGRVQLEILSNQSDLVLQVEALVLPRLTGTIPHVASPNTMSGITNIQLADPTYNKPGPVEIILGADIFADVLVDGRIPAQFKRPALYNTVFGWVVSGKASSAGIQGSKPIAVHHLTVRTMQLNDELKRFWELEEVSPVCKMTKEEIDCETHFTTTHSRNSDGRYVVQLPFRDNVQRLGQSRHLAVTRLVSVERRLKSQPELNKAYQNFMMEYLNLNHMEKVPIEQHNGRPPEVNYIPHHCVIKLDSKTTPLRVVFDASMKTTSGISLNETLMVGARQQDDIWDIITRFRLHAIAIVADISKMYRQIHVAERDTDSQRILWRANHTDPIDEYRLTTVTYGMACAPFLATRVLVQLAKDEAKRFPLAAKRILTDFYVDDLISGANSRAEAIELQTQLQMLLSYGGFSLRKWCSSDPTILEGIDEELRASTDHFELHQSESVKTLGIWWHPGEDMFCFKVNMVEPEKYTKRTVLSEVSKLFDPLGWLAPIIVVAKIFIQRLWLTGCSWDQELPPDLVSQWTQFRDQLQDIQSIFIPRCITVKDSILLQLHGFSDASEVAYSAVVYLRSENAKGEVNTFLVSAKTRVTPVKQVSLPRLELCGAVLLAKLLTRVQKAIQWSISQVFAWTDSSVVLAWISEHSRNWTTFVANRVGIIQELIPPDCWRHVPGKDNPADIASRGASPETIKKDLQWWQGPRWIKLNQELWPNRQYSAVETSLERRKARPIVTLTATVSTVTQEFSSLSHLKRVMAYCYRFIQNCKRERDSRISGPLTPKELNDILMILVKQAQQEAFCSVIKCIDEGRKIPSHLTCLNPFLDADGVLRVGGRLRHSLLPYSQRFPALLPSGHHLTDLIIMHAHIQQLHAGPQATLAQIRQQFWIVNGRNVVRRLIHQCQQCVRDRGRTLTQQMGDLPSERLTPDPPFTRSGLDFAGPIYIKSGRQRNSPPVKAYVCLFVCFATKAIHLELVSDLSTEAFLAALKRFISRRGLCQEVYSDNGSTFVGANHELKKLRQLFLSQQHKEKVSKFSSDHGINWHFIPPRAPHFGGLWEAGVKSMKTHLRRVVGNGVLTFEEMVTLLAQIEACLNSRPLTPLSSDPSDLEALTPGHFLIGRALTAVAEPSLTYLKENRLSRWQRICQFTEHIWRRWQAEYLTQLQQRTRWRSPADNLKIGDLVVIKDENLPPLQWPKGRVVQVLPGKDQRVRVVEVKTEKGVFKRPVAKLCLLPTPCT